MDSQWDLNCEIRKYINNNILKLERINLDILRQFKEKACQESKAKTHAKFPFPQMKHQEKPPEEILTELTKFVLLDFADIPHLEWFLSLFFF